MGIRFHDVLVHLPAVGGGFAEHCDTAFGRGGWSAMTRDGAWAGYQWTSSDASSSVGVDFTGLRLDFRSPFPAALAADVKEYMSGVGGPVVSTTPRPLPELAHALRERVRSHLDKLLGIVRATTVERIGVVAEFELPDRLLRDRYGVRLAALAGTREPGTLSEAVFQVQTDLPERDDVARAWIATLTRVALTAAQEHRFSPSRTDPVSVLGLDYQERYKVPITVAASGRQNRSPGLASACIALMDRAEGEWNASH